MVKRIPTTKKIACFKSQRSVRRTNIESLGGISVVLGCRLRKQGFSTVTALKRRTRCMTKCDFRSWMKVKTCANGRNSDMAYKSLYGKVSKKTIRRKLSEKPKRRC